MTRLFDLGEGKVPGAAISSQSSSTESQYETVAISVGEGQTESSQVEQQVESPQQVGSNPPASNSYIVPAQETQIPTPTGVPGEDFSNSQQPPQQQQQQQNQQKESVFVRLTNRIKNLERNQTLTSSYLEELSRRFKKHNEETVILNDSNKRALNESRVKIRQMDDFYRQELQSLRRNMDDVRERLFNVQLQRSLLIIICLMQTIFIVIGCTWVKRKIVVFETKLNPSHVMQESENEREVKPFRSPSMTLLGRKRSNSDVTPVSMMHREKPKKLKKKNKKNNNPQQQGDKLLGTNEIKREVLLPNVTKLGRFTLTPAELAAPVSLSTNANQHNSPNFLIPAPASGSSSTGSRPTTLMAKVDSPFTFQSSWISSLESGVSSSGRFALLASPGGIGGPDSPVRSVRSLEAAIPYTFDASRQNGSSNRSSLSSTTSGGGGGTASVTVNGYHSPQQVNNVRMDSTSGQLNTTLNSKKVKKGGLKSFMPKIFDR
jgi:hypothetical protein